MDIEYVVKLYYLEHIQALTHGINILTCEDLILHVNTNTWCINGIQTPTHGV
jgi:hypothetical protein